MNVSPSSSGTLVLTNKTTGDVTIPTKYPESYTCFFISHTVSAQAVPKSGYQFHHWTLEPQPRSFNATANPTSFLNDEPRRLTAYFVSGTTPPPITAPLPPRNVAASDGTYTTKINISWSASSGATSYEIYRAASSTGLKSFIGSATTTSYSDSNISCPNTYYYWVTAKNSSGTSALSSYDSGSCASTTPPPGGIPSPPANISASDGTYTSKINVSWSASSGATSYEVYRAASTGSLKSLIATVASTSYSDSNISCPNTYYYWIKAKNSSGTSSLSAYDAGSCKSGTVDPPPTGNAVKLTVLKAKEKIDENKDVIVIDVSKIQDFDDGHILCALNLGWNSNFNFFNFNIINDDYYRNKDVLIYDQEDTYAQTAAEYLIANGGFTSVYYMDGGLAAWMAEGFETTDTDGPCSLPPMAHAGPDQTVDENKPVTLDASKSSDPDGGELIYSWKQFSGTADVIFDDPSAPNPSFTAPYVQEGGDSLTFHLTVTSETQKMDMDSVTVFVQWVSTPPVANAGTDQTVKEGDLVTLNGSASTDADDDGIQSYYWEQTGGPDVDLTNADKTAATFIAPDIETEPTQLTFRLTVIDPSGKEDADQVAISIMENNKKPLADSGENATVTETHTVTLDGSDSMDPDGTIIKYEWTLLSGPTVTIVNSGMAKASFVAPSVNTDNTTLTFQLIVYDDFGEASDPAEVTLTVKDVGEIPFAHAGATQNVYEGAKVTLDAALSKDPDGSIATYLWRQIQGPEVILSNTGAVNPEFTAPPPEIYHGGNIVAFELTVTDKDGLKSTDQVSITVTASAPPLANAGTDQSVNEGKMVTLDGSLSSDPDDGIKSFLWLQTSGTPATLSDPSAEKPEFKAPKIKNDEVLTFELTVEDFSGRSSTDEVRTTVNNKSSSSGGCFISTLD